METDKVGDSLYTFESRLDGKILKLKKQRLVMDMYYMIGDISLILKKKNQLTIL